MGVFSERIFALFLAVPWRSRGAAGGPKDAAEAVPQDWSETAPTRQTGWEHSPSSSVLRADLEIMRQIARVR